MKGFGIFIFFAALVAYASAAWGDPIIPNHPTCIDAIESGDYVSFADKSLCTHFYSCDWRNAVRHECPPDNQTPNWEGLLVYNPVLEVCDHRPVAEANGAKCPF